MATRARERICSGIASLTELLRSGATLSQIGQLLRHESHDTTRIYAKVDIEALQTLSLPWPGGVQ